MSTSHPFSFKFCGHCQIENLKYICHTVEIEEHLKNTSNVFFQKLMKGSFR